jgi:hypothetical protein
VEHQNDSMKDSSENEDLEINEKGHTIDKKLNEKDFITLDPNDKVLKYDGELPKIFASFSNVELYVNLFP